MQEIVTIRSLGQAIRRARKQQGLTQMQLAGVAGVGLRFIRELEQGKESCHIGKALSVARLLGLSLMLTGQADE